jgi:hypothetical protein
MEFTVLASFFYHLVLTLKKGIVSICVMVCREVSPQRLSLEEIKVYTACGCEHGGSIVGRLAPISRCQPSGNGLVLQTSTRDKLVWPCVELVQCVINK